MLLELVVAAGLSAVAADPAPRAYAPRTLPPAYQQVRPSASPPVGGFSDEVAVVEKPRPHHHPDHEYVEEAPVSPFRKGGSVFYGEEGAVAQPGCQSCVGHPQHFRAHFLFSPCDMYQRYPYWNKERGYYYFRPYHVAHVVMQQEKAASWGGDTRNPYDNRSLDKIYDDWSAEQEIIDKARKVEDLPNTPGEIDMDDPPSDLPEDTMPPKASEPMPMLEPEDSPAPPSGNGASKPRAGQLKKFVTYR